MNNFLNKNNPLNNPEPEQSWTIQDEDTNCDPNTRPIKMQ